MTKQLYNLSVETRVYAFLQKQGGYWTTRDIRKYISASKSAINQALLRLKRKGLIRSFKNLSGSMSETWYTVEGVK